jgi:AmmeMemoRadiSam system protein A
MILEMDEMLTLTEKRILLKLAREALEIGVKGNALKELNLEELPDRLKQDGVSFVTLMKDEHLRGCIGALEATRPLAQDVQQHAIAAALDDYRFPPVQADELGDITIEISYLTPPVSLKYEVPRELINYLRPGIDGVVIRDGVRRATFLPQVWEKIPEANNFLNMLCQKMGAPPDYWQKKRLEVLTYQVEKFSE